MWFLRYTTEQTNRQINTTGGEITIKWFPWISQQMFSFYHSMHWL